MLEYKLTPHHTGIALWGDFAALDRLRGLVLHIVEESDYIEDKEGFVMGLSYDLRKAVEGQRSKDFRSWSENDRYAIYGVEMLWPVLLVQIAVLRQAMAYMPTNKLDQPIMFEFEHVVESAIREAMPVTSDEVIHQIRLIGAVPYMHLDSVLDSRCVYFIELQAKKRLKTLPKLMETFGLIYSLLPPSGARRGAIQPEEFVGKGAEWPDFEW